MLRRNLRVAITATGGKIPSSTSCNWLPVSFQTVPNPEIYHNN